ncbi:flagellar hook protein FlgE [Mesorhizobium microcysteis]|jgi:flagellar hook protein FlgE|uniref:Flagellar hook protein FlgE n=1 Tax=Neoaquamicrobium microcysteis TaxID=2682781 RepID=A0A5D4GMT3_9HYPH|nr:flagellar hook protein FlgE [Mesorhizobium microcysteis]TYR30136.1 flagellar hook protein FlgE [Mesorhizobium microcysteis]
MSLYGMMRTGVSGMAAQSTRLGTVADNIANSGTNGYKKASVEFSSMIIPNSGSSYISGGVATQVRYSITQAGPIQYTTSGTDLAVDGNGFFVVQNSNGQPFLTRAGSFVPDGEGRLVNAAGFQLMGYSYENGIPSTVANGFAGLVPVQISGQELQATPTTIGNFAANLPYAAPDWTGVDLSTNPANPVGLDEGLEDGSVIKTSLVAYNNVGEEVLLDIYFAKQTTGEWQMSVYYQPDGTAGSSFPYSGPALATGTLEFDISTGKLDAASMSTLTIDLTGLNGQAIDLDLSKMTNLATGYSRGTATMNGNSPSAVERISIAKDGVMYAEYANGARTPLYKLALATVQSPDMLRVEPGNVFSAGLESGNVQIGFAGGGGLGDILSGAVENSNVDIAEELTNMIESQRNYTANSKVFQTGSDLMDVLVNLKR